MTEKTNFGEWVLMEMEARGWTMSELARRCSVSQVAISNVINGNRNAGPDLCRALAVALELPEEKIFRLAGLLSRLPTEQDLTFGEVYDMMQHLTPDERQEVMEYVAWRYRRRRVRPE